MNKLACQYALLRFRPFVETGEFANVGVVLLSPEGRFFGYKLSKKYGRITQFFHQLDSQVYLNGKALFSEELDRFANGMDAPTRIGTRCAKVEMSAFPLEPSRSVHHEGYYCRH